MAASVTIDQRPKSAGDEMRVRATVTMDNSYPTGGEPIAASSLGLRYITSANCNISAHNGAFNVSEAVFDPATSKLKLFGALAEIGNASDCSDVKVQIVAFGK